MSSSEDVLLMVNHVHHKKVAGTMYLMNERLAWMPNAKDTFTISHRYADIKMQKISPEGKAKVQLQVVLHNGENTTFHFVNPSSVNDQLQDRNGVKELLQQLLPKFKRKMNKELEEKNIILSSDPALYQLYKDLVVTQVITADEFWANYVKKPVQESLQETGISGAFLNGISPQTDGSGIRYNITPEIIDSIFRTYPAVKRKHMENVPHKLSESEFWTKFFQSHYFHRDRPNLTKDLFSECVKMDDQDVKNAIEQGIPDPFVDVASFEEDSLTDEASRNKVDKAVNKGEASLIRRFNHHSMMVLQSCSNKKRQPETTQNGGASTSHCDKKQMVASKTDYDDLRPSVAPSVNQLNLTKVARYLSGPVPVAEDGAGASAEDLVFAADVVHDAVARWRPDLPAVLAPSSAIVALGDMMPGGSMMKNMDGTQLKDQVPVEIQSELKQLYGALSELLRHFWCCFPTTSPQLEEKVLAMQTSLQRFEYVKLQPFQDKLARSCLPSNLCDHLRSLLSAAYKKFSNWQARHAR